MKVLLVEDDSAIRNILRMRLEADSFTVDEAEDGERGSYFGRINNYDLIILDNILPKKLGGKVCQEIRESGVQSPILILSAKTEVLSKIDLLEKGADDYLTKPFSYEELMARMKALLRRPVQIAEEVFHLGPIVLNKSTGEVFVKHKRIYFTRREYSLLLYFFENQGKIISRGNILDNVWEMSVDPFSNTVETHITLLRKKIGDKNKKIIQCLPGRGYRLASGKA